MRTDFLLFLYTKLILLALFSCTDGFPSWFYAKKQVKDSNNRSQLLASENHASFKSRNAISENAFTGDEIGMDYGFPKVISEDSIFTAIQPYIPTSTELPPLLTIQTYPNSEASPATLPNYEQRSSQVSAVPYKSYNLPEIGNPSSAPTKTLVLEKVSQISVSTSTPDLISHCDEDNCLRNFIRSSTAFSEFCSSYTANNVPKITGLPSRVSLCDNDSYRISSACTCFMKGFAPTSLKNSFISPSPVSISTTFISSDIASPIFVPSSQLLSSIKSHVNQPATTSLFFAPSKVSFGGYLEPSILSSTPSIKYSKSSPIASGIRSLSSNSKILATTAGEIFWPSSKPYSSGPFTISNSTLISKTPCESVIKTVYESRLGPMIVSNEDFPVQTMPLSLPCYSSPSKSQALSNSILPYTTDTSALSSTENSSSISSIFQIIISTILVNSVTVNFVYSEESSMKSAAPTDLVFILTATVSLTGPTPSISHLLEASSHLSSQVSEINSKTAYASPQIYDLPLRSSLQAGSNILPSYSITIKTIFITPTETVYLSAVSTDFSLLPSSISKSILDTPKISNFSNFSNTANYLPSNTRHITSSSIFPLVQSKSIDSGLQNTGIAPVSIVHTTTGCGKSFILSEGVLSSKSIFKSISHSYTLNSGYMLSKQLTETENSPLTTNANGIQLSFSAPTSTHISTEMGFRPTSVEGQLSSPILYDSISASVTQLPVLPQYSSFGSQESENTFHSENNISNESELAFNQSIWTTGHINPTSTMSSGITNSHKLTNNFATVTSLPSFSKADITSNLEAIESTIILNGYY